MTHRFEYALWLDVDGKEIRTLAWCVAHLRQGATIPVESLDRTALFLEDDARDWMPYKWILGDLGRMIRQTEAAIARLINGDFAIIRSAIDDRHPVAYYLFQFESDAEDAGAATGTVSHSKAQVLISLFVLEGDLGFVYPTHKPEGADLYAHVAANLEFYNQRPQQIPVASDIRFARVDRADLLASMAREVELGRALYAALGVPLV